MLLFRRLGVLLLLCGGSFYLPLASAETTAPKPPTAPPPAPVEMSEADRTAKAEAELTAKAEEQKNTVYSLRDFERESRQEATDPRANDADYDRDYATDSRDAYVGEDGIQRSLEGPDVVITAGAERTVYEYRQNGQLRMVKIIPNVGRPYYLVPADQTRGYGDLGQADMLLPQWIIVEF